MTSKDDILQVCQKNKRVACAHNDCPFASNIKGPKASKMNRFKFCSPKLIKYRANEKLHI